MGQLRKQGSREPQEILAGAVSRSDGGVMGMGVCQTAGILLPGLSAGAARLPPLPEHQPMEGCSCFTLGKKQVKREKTKICNYTVHRLDSRHSPVLWHAQLCVPGRQGPGSAGQEEAPGLGTQEMSHGSVPVLLLHWDAACGKRTRSCTEGKAAPLSDEGSSGGAQCPPKRRAHIPRGSHASKG